MNIIQFLLWFILILGILCIITGVFLSFRNNAVYRLRLEIIDICGKWNRCHIDETIKDRSKDMLFRYNLLPSYDTMLYSVKKLTIEKWLPKDMLDELNAVQSTN